MFIQQHLPSRRQASRNHHRRLHIEPLEDRRVLAVITVTTTADTSDQTDGVTSLREAIFLANLLAGADTIRFGSALSGKTISLNSQLPTITTEVSIAGPGAKLLTIDAGGGATTSPGDGWRVFNIDDGVSASLVSVEISGLTITGGDPNAAALSGAGGGIRNLEQLTLVDTIITGNTASNGGGIYNSGTLAVAASTLSDNTAAMRGGAIHSDGALSISGTTLSANKAADGAAIDSQGPATIVGSTLSGNTATNSGGGIYNRYSLSLAGSTVTANSASYGGGIYNSAAATVRGSIVAGNVASLDGNNLVGGLEASSGFNLIDLDPRLAPLADNGGPTLTHALLPDSPALDAGDPTAVPGVGGIPQFDQRGMPYGRVADGNDPTDIAIDIGAYEAQGPVDALPGDYNRDGHVGIADFALWRDTLGSSIAPLSGADGDGDGLVSRTDYRVWKSHFGSQLPPPPAPITATDEAFAGYPTTMADTMLSPTTPVQSSGLASVSTDLDSTLLLLLDLSTAESPAVDPMSEAPQVESDAALNSKDLSLEVVLQPLAE